MDNLYLLSKNNPVCIVDNSLDNGYYQRIIELCRKYKNFKFKHIDISVIPRKSLFQRRVIESANHIRKLFLNSDCDYFMTVESDVLPPVDIIERFKESIKHLPENWGMLGALYHGQYNPAIKKGGGFHDLGKEVKGLYQPAQVLCGCTIYNRKLIEKFPFRWSMDDLGHFHDYWICQDAKNDFTFWDDRDINCLHFPSNSINDRDIK